MSQPSFFDFDDDFDGNSLELESTESKCTCGAHNVYGIKCPEEFHYSWCDYLKNKYDNITDWDFLD